MKRVLLINEGGLGNVGDEAIRCCLEHLLRSRGCHVEWAAFSRAAPVRASHARSRPGRAVWWKRVFRALVPAEVTWLTRYGCTYLPYLRSADFDLAVVGGGQLIQSNGVFALAMFLWVLLLKRVHRRPLVLVSVGVADRFTPMDRALFRWALRRVDGVYVRDRASATAVAHVFGVPAGWCPDAAFCVADVIPANQPATRRVLFCPVDYAFYVRKKGSGGDRLTERQYWQYWVDKVEWYASKGYDVRFLCTSRRQDISFVERLQGFLAEDRGLAVEVDAANTLPAVCELIQSAEVVVAARMHALILGYVYAREVVAFPTSEKIEAFQEEYLEHKEGPAMARRRIGEVMDELVRGIYLTSGGRYTLSTRYHSCLLWR